MNKIKRLSHFLLGTILFSVSQWVVLILLVKSSSPEVVGQYGLALAICSPIILFSNMHLRTVLSTDSINQFSFLDYYDFRKISIMIFLLFVISFTYFYAENWSIFLVIVMLAFCKASESVSDIYFGFFNKYGTIDYISTSMLIKSVGLIFSYFIGIHIYSSLEIALLITFVAWSSCVIFYDRKNIVKLLALHPKELNTRYQNKTDLIRSIFIVGAPLSIVAILDSLNTYLPRYILQAESSLYYIGIFTALYYVIMAGNTLVSAIAQTLNPLLAKELKLKNKHGFYRLTTWYVVGGVFAGGIPLILAVNFGEQFLRLVYGVEYSIYSTEFVMILMGGLFAYCAVLAWHINVTLRQIKHQPKVSLATTVTTMALGVALIPYDYILGASIAMAGGRLVQLMGNIILMKLSLKKIFNVESLNNGFGEQRYEK